MKKALLLILLSTCAYAQNQKCTSMAAASYGGWRSVKTAPRDGTVVEMIETFGVAPWYGLFQWTKGKSEGTDRMPPIWFQLDTRQPGTVVTEDECLFWRPYKGTVKDYVDPTGGFQKSIAYWCTAMHAKYDKKKDRCIP